MKKVLALVAVVLCATVLTPARAEAHAGWWDWFEGLSGPGPFSNGWVLDMRLACSVRTPTDRNVQAAAAAGQPQRGEEWTPIWRGNDAAKHCLVNSNEVGGYFEIRGGVISTPRDKPLFHDKPFELPGRATLHQIQGVFMRQIDPIVAIGAGAGVVWFSGSNIDGTVTNFTITPISVAVSPLRLVKRDSSRAGFVLIRWEEVAIMGSMEAKDFNAASTSSFRIRNDMVRSLSVTFDILTALGKVP